jgi:plastocyanin
MGDSDINEQDILNFALNLEYLGAEFYAFAATGKSITSFGIGIKGRANGENPAAGGTTIGGKQVTFADNELFTHDIAAEIGADERAAQGLIELNEGKKLVAARLR